MSSSNEAGWSEWATTMEYGPLRVRAGFRRPSTELVAGGPLELQFFLEANEPMALAVAADRVRQRPDFFRFSATLEGATIDDPFPGSTTYLGGPGTVVQPRPDNPWQQWLIVNQYLRLERALELIAPGLNGALQLCGGRPLPLTTSDAEAYRREGVPQLDITMSIPVRRDDRRLVACVNELVEQVRNGPPERRERPLELLLSLRAPVAVEQWKSLLGHPDATVVERVRQGLQLANEAARSIQPS